MIDQVSNVQIETDILKGESDALTNSIAQLVNRAESANERAAATLAESNKTFTEAEEQLRVVENFQNISSGEFVYLEQKHLIKKEKGPCGKKVFCHHRLGVPSSMLSV